MTEAAFNISVNDNDILEETETFNIIINSSSLPNNVTVGELDEAVVTILDNDREFYQIEMHSHHLEQVRGICIFIYLGLLTSIMYSNVIALLEYLCIMCYKQSVWLSECVLSVYL